VDEVRRVDLPRVAGSRRDPERIGRVLRSLARHSASYAAATAIAADAGGADGPLDADTVRAYLDALSRIFVVEDQPAWAPHLRSRSILRSEPKRHFADPSLAVAALGATPDRLLKDPNLLGLLFESLVIRDLRVYALASDATVRQYRDNTGLEVDAIVECADGRWAAFEIKLGASWVEAGASTLKRFADRVDTTKVGRPAALGVIVGTGYAYVRDDGIAVIPIGTLSP
jgi:predicted AAA+ superfamily ATPase